MECQQGTFFVAIFSSLTWAQKPKSDSFTYSKNNLNKNFSHIFVKCKQIHIFIHVYLQVNALSERIIRIYLHEFTNNERENSIPHEAAECGIENFEFIVSERVQVNPDNSRAMSALTFLLFKLNTLQTKIVKLWVSRSHGVMTVVYWNYTTAITPG